MASRTIAFSQARLNRFWARVDKSGGPDACWPWTGKRQREGYGRLEVERRNAPAHVVAWILTHGPLPADKPLACHHCDNPPCCNPAHIFPGTHADNAADCLAKGRHVSALGLQRGVRGQAHYRAKLSKADIREIRNEIARGDSFGAIGRRRGVHAATISSIHHRKSWSWLSAEAVAS